MQTCSLPSVLFTFAEEQDNKHFSHQLLFVSDSSGMWEDNEAEEGEDDDEEDEGLAGQLLSDLIASNKYGTSFSPVPQLSMQFPFSFMCILLILLLKHFVLVFESPRVFLSYRR